MRPWHVRRVPVIITGEMEGWPALGLHSRDRWWGSMGCVRQPQHIVAVGNAVLAVKCIADITPSASAPEHLPRWVCLLQYVAFVAEGGPVVGAIDAGI